MFRFQTFRELLPLCPGPMQEVISRFSRYQRTVSSLDGRERKKADDIAEYIFSSFRPGCTPILKVRLVGHADTDLQRGRKFEQEISVERAVEVEKYLRRKVADLSLGFKTAPNSPKPVDILWTHDGVGSTQPAPENRGRNPNALGEAARAVNRRVEIIIEPGPAPQPTVPWSFDPVDATKRLQKVVDDSLKRHFIPGPPPTIPNRFFQNLPKLDKKDEWRKLIEDIKDWCQSNHVDVDPILDTFKDILQLPGGGAGPLDDELQKELKRRQVIPDRPSDDD